MVWWRWRGSEITSGAGGSRVKFGKIRRSTLISTRKGELICVGMNENFRLSCHQLPSIPWRTTTMTGHHQTTSDVNAVYFNKSGKIAIKCLIFRYMEGNFIIISHLTCFNQNAISLSPPPPPPLQFFSNSMLMMAWRMSRIYYSYSSIFHEMGEATHLQFNTNHKRWVLDLWNFKNIGE